MKNCTQKEEWHSDTVTAVVVPPYIDSAEIVRRAWKRYNLSLGLGLNKVAGKVFRIGHLGNLNEVKFLFSSLLFSQHSFLMLSILPNMSVSLYFQIFSLRNPSSLEFDIMLRKNM